MDDLSLTVGSSEILQSVHEHVTPEQLSDAFIFLGIALFVVCVCWAVNILIKLALK